MHFPRLLRNRRTIASIGAAVLGLAGCIFDSKYQDLSVVPQSYRTQILDTLYPADSEADSVISLYQPLLDASLKAGAVAAPETFPPVNVKDHSLGKVLQYRLTRQRFGSWTPELEFRWNYFVLRSNFLFTKGLPDTTGLGDSTKALYGKIHLEDAFTNYFDSAAAPAIWNRINTSTKPGAIGISVRLSSGGDSVIIQQVVAGSPAGRAGLLRGMAILAVNDSSTVGDSALTRFQRFSAGDSGTQVRLSVIGPGAGPGAEFRLVREPVAFPTVLVDSLGGAGYIAVSGFTPNTVGSKSTATEFRDALAATRKFPVTILDLRDNGGGSLDLALRMCDEIVPVDVVMIRQLQRRFDEGAHVPLESEVTALGQAGGTGERAADGSRRKYLLLGNGQSASASEIFLVSVREAIQAPLMGTRTYGKGVGQTVRNTPGKGLALVTFLKFTSQSGLDYHKHGLEPDYPDSSASDALLAHAAEKAAAMAGNPAAFSVAKGAAAFRYRADLARRAGAIEWNRKEARRPGMTDLEAIPSPGP